MIVRTARLWLLFGTLSVGAGFHASASAQTQPAASPGPSGVPAKAPGPKPAAGVRQSVPSPHKGGSLMDQRSKPSASPSAPATPSQPSAGGYVEIRRGSGIIRTPETERRAREQARRSPALPAVDEDIDPVDRALRSGDFETAVTLCNARVASTPGDDYARRSLALSLVMKGDMPRAVAALSDLAQRNPQVLTSIPSSCMHPASKHDFRSAVSRMMAYAARVRSADALYATAVLKHWENRPDVSRIMLSRARTAGYGEFACNSLETALPASPSRAPRGSH